METKQASLTETLTEERIREVGEKIAGLPTGDEFMQKVEEDLWQKFVGDDNLEDDESVEWDDLPDKSKSVIGYVDEEGTEVPWWLESLKWKASSGAETMYIDDSLSVFGNTNLTEIHQPRLDENITSVLSSFDRLHEAIDERVGINGENSDYSLGEDIFRMSDGKVETTNTFKEWFENLLGLCPPYNRELTSLLMVNSNVRREVVREAFSDGDDILETLESVGYSGEKIREEEYRTPLADIMREMDGVFDIDIKLPEGISTLEILFYESWAENYYVDEDRLKWLDKANGKPINLFDGEETMFTREAFELPLRRTRRGLVYVTWSESDGFQDANDRYSTAGERSRIHEEIMHPSNFR
jgi:hypothetical protein